MSKGGGEEKALERQIEKTQCPLSEYSRFRPPVRQADEDVLVDGGKSIHFAIEAQMSEQKCMLNWCDCRNKN